jgi:DNA repair protein RecN (Recombination protein N)
MLAFLNISNLAVINHLHIEFQPGLNILSGETGSGKSIIIDALGLLLGEKAVPEMIRTGEEKAFVEGIFDIEGNIPLQELLSSSGIERDSDEIAIKREINLSGRSRAFINNQSATLALLKCVQPHLIDIHGQGDQQSLLSPETHLDLLDTFAGALEERRQVEQIFDEMVRLVKEVEFLERIEADRLRTLDMLDYQIQEIERARLVPNEDLELEAERRIQANVEKLAKNCGEAYSLLYEDESSVLSRVSAVERRLSELSEIDDRFSGALEQISAAKFNLEDLAFFLRKYAESLSFSPEKLKEVDDRLLEIDRLRRKYGNSVSVILEHLGQLRNQKNELQHSEEKREEFCAHLRKVFKQYAHSADRLSELRYTRASALEEAVGAELAEVALENAQFAVKFDLPSRSALAGKIGQWVDGAGGGAIGRRGKETAEFLFSANRGEAARPLSGVASGGELSRLMLVLKTITAPTAFPRTLIFDEVDAGIGGRVAEAVGQRLKRLSETNQVLCVTHQAHIARYASTHFHVNKVVDGDRTVTSVMELRSGERVDELARMLGGAEITATARRHAKELLRDRG